MTIDSEAPPNPVPVPGEAVLSKGAAGVGLASLSRRGIVLDVWYGINAATQDSAISGVPGYKELPFRTVPQGSPAQQREE